MDSATLRVKAAIYEYLEDVEQRSKLPIDNETRDALKTAMEGIEKGDLQERTHLSPGQREALSLSEEIIANATFSEDDDMSPGQRAVQDAAAG